MKPPLAVLLTNIWLTASGGSEVVVRDLALGLLRRGHRPIVYTPSLGPFAEGLSARGISVIDDLQKLAEAPDIIHAHHSIPCGEALIRFPHVPAIYVCHAFDHWVEAPVHFPQIGTYVAVDEACRDRLVHREGIKPNTVVVLRNGVDLSRIPPRPQPPKKRPHRALGFGKTAVAPEPRAACEQLGIEYDVIGFSVGRVSACPERELVNFDLVFATARAALEAICCGCAVIVCDPRGFSGLVTSNNFATLRARNFGLRSLSETLTIDRCVNAVGRYDAADATRVAEAAREDADLEKLLDQFEKLYGELLSHPPIITSEAQERAVARFLHENLPRRPGDARWPWMAEREHLQQEIQSLERVVLELTGTRCELEARLTRANQDLSGVSMQLANCDEARLELEARLTRADQDLSGISMQLANCDEARLELEARLAEALKSLTATSAQLADLKRSRLLKIGRLFRRLIARPIPY
jgi:hypothetical protein